MKAFTNQLAIVDKSLGNINIILIFFNLPKTYNLMMTLESIDIKNFTIDYVTTRLSHGIGKHKKTNPQK